MIFRVLGNDGKSRFVMGSLSHCELWINTKYFLDAMRCVCSLLYFRDHCRECEFIDTVDFVDAKLHRFFINLCALIDMHCNNVVSRKKQSVYKKMLKTMCPSFHWLFYERDKNAAHKDSDYYFDYRLSYDVLLPKMKKAIKDVKLICNDVFSTVVPLCFYSYDPLLYRYINGITPAYEKKINHLCYLRPDAVGNVCFGQFDAISDIRQVRYLSDFKRPAVFGTNGFIFEKYDMLQHFEDFLIRLNGVYNWDAWITLRDVDTGGDAP